MGKSIHGPTHLGAASQRFCQLDSPCANPATINRTSGGTKGDSNYNTATVITSKGECYPTNPIGQYFYRSLHLTNKASDTSTKHKKQQPWRIILHQPCSPYSCALALHRYPSAGYIAYPGSHCHATLIKPTQFCTITPFPKCTDHQPGSSQQPHHERHHRTPTCVHPALTMPQVHNATEPRTP